ncbi:MAG: tRNA lysidine(34) synthetase TilS [Parabacteroides sp.]
MIDKVHLYIQQHKLLTPESPVLVGLSGGADSVALLAVLCRLGYTCIALHCNFHLRGEESMRDEAFARQIATERFQIPFYKQDFDTETYAKFHHLSIEMAARELRYAWFESMRRQLGAQAIAVAHHRDDQVETVLMNLLRGSGIRGMAGIRPKQGAIVRPLLTVGRDEIVDWLTEEQLSFVTDSTNLSDAYTRNFIRLRIIPLLEQINPSAKRSMARTVAHLAEVEQVYRASMEQAIREVTLAEGCFSIPLLLLQPAPSTLLYELLRPYGFSPQLCESVYQSLDKESGKEFYSETHRLVKDRESCWIVPISRREQPESWTIPAVEGLWEGPVRLTFHRLERSAAYCIPRRKETICLDADKLRFPLCLRRWQQGDWFVPFGMKGRKKISDYFSDRKFCRVQKEQAWLLCSGEQVVWLIGERMDDRFRVTEQTKWILEINFSG